MAGVAVHAGAGVSECKGEVRAGAGASARRQAATIGGKVLGGYSCRGSPRAAQRVAALCALDRPRDGAKNEGESKPAVSVSAERLEQSGRQALIEPGSAGEDPASTASTKRSRAVRVRTLVSLADVACRQGC